MTPEQLRSFFKGRRLPEKPYLITKRIGEMVDPKKFIKNHLHQIENHPGTYRAYESMKLLTEYKHYCETGKRTI